MGTQQQKIGFVWVFFLIGCSISGPYETLDLCPVQNPPIFYFCGVWRTRKKQQFNLQGGTTFLFVRDFGTEHVNFRCQLVATLRWDEERHFADPGVGSPEMGHHPCGRDHVWHCKNFETGTTIWHKETQYVFRSSNTPKDPVMWSGECPLKLCSQTVTGFLFSTSQQQPESICARRNQIQKPEGLFHHRKCFICLERKHGKFWGLFLLEVKLTRQKTWSEPGSVGPSSIRCLFMAPWCPKEMSSYICGTSSWNLTPPPHSSGNRQNIFPSLLLNFSVL